LPLAYLQATYSQPWAGDLLPTSGDLLPKPAASQPPGGASTTDTPARRAATVTATVGKGHITSKKYFESSTVWCLADMRPFWSDHGEVTFSYLFLSSGFYHLGGQRVALPAMAWVELDILVVHTRREHPGPKAALPASRILEPKKQKPVGTLGGTSITLEKLGSKNSAPAGLVWVLGTILGGVVGGAVVCAPFAVELSFDDVVGAGDGGLGELGWSCSCW
jgi:hypothetical protein